MDAVSVLQAGDHVGEPLAACAHATHVTAAAEVRVLQEDVQEQVQPAGAREDIAREQAERRQDRGRLRRATDNDGDHRHDHHAARADHGQSHLPREVVSPPPVSHRTMQTSTRTFLMRNLSS